MKEEKIKLFLKEFFEMAPDFRKKMFFQPNAGNKKISPHQFYCLKIISQAKEISMSELADNLGVSNQQLTRITNDLTEHNFIERYTDPSNRRIVLAKITEEGRFFINISQKIMHDKIAAKLNHLTEKELDDCINHIKSLAAILKKI